MKILIWATAILSSFVCGSALSADVAAPTAYDWSGGYLGIDFGAAMIIADGSPRAFRQPLIPTEQVWLLEVSPDIGTK